MIRDFELMGIEFRVDVDLKDYCTYKVGGRGSVLVLPKDVDELKLVMDYVISNDIRYMVIGNGSNLIFSDDGFDGVLIKLDRFNEVCFDENLVRVGSGCSLISLSLLCARNGLSGLEFAGGIPGTLGGAVYMNAGAYNSDIGMVVKCVRVLDNSGSVIELNKEDLNFDYRYSILRDKDYICLDVTLELKNGNRDNIISLMEDRKRRRRESQPLEYPSAGSVFRNPLGDFAGRIIEELEFKGKCVGGAMVSVKHANFIVNYDNASSGDIVALINDIKDKVKDVYGIDLVLEQEIVE